MHKGTEIDFVLNDSLKALELYQTIFDEIQLIEATDYPRGNNEVIFTLYGTRFHMLDENTSLGLTAPTAEHPNTIWFNIIVSDIEDTHNKALRNGCVEIQEMTEMMDFGVTNSMFRDPFGYLWMLHQVHSRIISPFGPIGSIFFNHVMFMMRLVFVSDIFCICLLFEKARLFHVLSLIYLMPIHFFAFHNYIV